MAKKNYREFASLGIFLLIVFTLMVTIKPEEAPPLWWDEGWTLSAVRNWVEKGVFALQLNGQWVSADPPVHPLSVTVPIAASFHMLGVGPLQGRLPGIIFTIGTLAFLFALAKRLYGSRVAWGTLFVVLCLAPSSDFQPLLVGRQAMGEMPMLFFLLAGYWFWGQVSRRSWKLIPLVWFFWGLAIITKRQALPFWMLSWLVPTFVALIQQKRQVFVITIISGLGAGLAALGFQSLDAWLVGSWPLYGNSIIEEAYKFHAWTWNLSTRLSALYYLVTAGIFTLVAVLVNVQRIYQMSLARAEQETTSWCELSLFVFVASWLAWYVLGSLSWLRHLFPAFLVSTIFFAKVLSNWTKGFSLSFLANVVGKSIRRMKINQEGLRSITALFLVGYGLGLNYLGLSHAANNANSDAYKVAEYVAMYVAPDAVVETYDSELLFFLDGPYHYPPDYVVFELNRRFFLQENIEISYDPLPEDSDYLIIGPFGKMWGLYQPALDSGAFKLVVSFNQYSIYERMR